MLWACCTSVCNHLTLPTTHNLLLYLFFGSFETQPFFSLVFAFLSLSTLVSGNWEVYALHTCVCVFWMCIWILMAPQRLINIRDKEWSRSKRCKHRHMMHHKAKPKRWQVHFEQRRPTMTTGNDDNSRWFKWFFSRFFVFLARIIHVSCLCRPIVCTGFHLREKYNLNATENT